MEFRAAVEAAHSAYLDGRLDNLGYKHRTIYALFNCLQTHTVAFRKASSDLGAELATTLHIINAALKELPTDLTGEFERAQKLADIGAHGSRSRPGGVIVIVADDDHPIASWAIPLTQAMMEGNAAVIFESPSASPFLRSLGTRIDQLAYPILQVDDVAGTLHDVSGVTGIVCPIDKLPSRIEFKPGSQPLVVRPVLTGPVPVIIDQSALPGGKPLSTEQVAIQGVPAPVRAVAQKVSKAVAFSRSLGKPAYILAHENLAPSLLPALEEALPQTKIQTVGLVEQREKATSFLSSQRGGATDFLPVYTVRSIDSALDFIQDGVPLPPVAYVFADVRFGAYAFNSLKQIPAMSINQFSQATLAVGPYANREDFSIHMTSHGEVVGIRDRDSARTPDDWIKEAASIKAKQLVQSSGSRIDFFGGGFLLAAGLTASMVLGVAGYGLVLVGKGVLKQWRT